MKNRLIKTTILIAVTTLVMLNIQLLFDTTNSPFMMGATAQTLDEETQYPSRFVPMHMIKLVRCWEFEFEADFVIIPIEGIPVPIPIPTKLGLNTNGSKWDCKKLDQVFYCDSEKMTECKTSDEEVAEDDAQ